MRAFYTSSFLLAWAVVAQAQGTVLFRNFDAGTGFNAPVFTYDSTRLSGADYGVELLAGSNQVSLQIIAQTSFLSGAQAGYFDGGLCTVSNLAPGSQAFLQVRVWNLQFGRSFAEAQAANVYGSWGSGLIFPLTLGDQASPAILTPLPALWLDSSEPHPVPLFVNFNRVDNTAVVSWSGYSISLEVSTNLVQWTNFIGSPPHAFPLNQGPLFFRTKSR